MNNLQGVAIEWISKGVSPVPIIYKSKIPAVNWKMWQKRTPPIKVAEYWFRDPQTNLAVICGGKNNLAILDFDDIDYYYDWRKEMLKRDDEWRDVSLKTYKVRTHRGMHLYLNTENQERSRKYPETSVDVRCSGNYTLAPPSIHPTGSFYKPIGNINDIITVRSLDTVFPNPYQNYIKHRGDNCNFNQTDIDTVIYDDVFDNIPKVTIADLKRKISILSFVGQFTHVSRGSTDGRFWWSRCINPTHEDKHPSFSIDAKTNRARCLSSKCILYHDIGLDVIDLYKILYGVGTAKAIFELSESCCI